ncbi:MAG: hypothetical protein QM719_08135 [Thermomonas sp.]
MAMLADLWLPILLSAVAVFVASSLIHMLFKWHNRDYRKLANEDAVRAAINAGQAAPGLYVIPHMVDGKDCNTEEAKAKFREGPVGKLTLRRPGAMSVGPMLLQWFLLNLAVAFVAACMAVGSMTGHHAAHTAGLATLLAYGAGAVSEAIWMGKPWSATLKDLLDALIYAVATAGVFLWLWP